MSKGPNVMFKLALNMGIQAGLGFFLPHFTGGFALQVMFAGE